MLDTSAIAWPVASESIRDAVRQALDDGSWGHYESASMELLIDKLKTNFQVDGAILCSSGTVAVELALRGAGVKANDEVILAGYDFPGNFRAVEAIGARPVLIDVVENGWVIDVGQIEPAVTNDTSAIIVSHLHGQAADLAGIRSIVDARNIGVGKRIVIVEDACQVPGGRIDGLPLGGIGNVSALSFGGSKLLSAGRGGAILSNDPDILQRARIFAQRGNEAFPLSPLQAAVLCPQFDTLGEMTVARNANAIRLIHSTSSIDDLIGLTQIVEGTLAAYYKLPWLLKDRTPGWARADFVQALQAEGVPVGEGFRGFLRRSPRRCRKVGTLVNSQIAAQQTVVLHHPVLLEAESTIDLIGEAIKKVISNSR